MATAEDYGFDRYSSHSPTCFDTHLSVDHLLEDDEDSREHWARMPVIRTRDSPVIDDCNFQEFLEGLGGESDTVEVHRFGHWGPGWYEIILVNPEDEKAMKAAYEMAGALQDYPVLNDEKLSEMETDDAMESWDNWARGDVERALSRMLERLYDDADVPEDQCPDFDDLADELINDLMEDGLPEYEMGSDGAHFRCDEIAEELYKKHESEHFE